MKNAMKNRFWQLDEIEAPHHIFSAPVHAKCDVFFPCATAKVTATTQATKCTIELIMDVLHNH
jgi:glutamate dehydrogenase/leucine dehydrogenase